MVIRELSRKPVLGLGGLQELVEMGLGPVKNRGFGSALVTE